MNREIPENQCGVVVPCRMGLHLRVAGRIAILAQNFHSDIHLLSDQLSADAKSLVSILMLGASRGKSLIIRARGLDAEQATQALSRLFLSTDLLCQEEPLVPQSSTPLMQGQQGL